GAGGGRTVDRARHASGNRVSQSSRCRVCGRSDAGRTRGGGAAGRRHVHGARGAAGRTAGWLASGHDRYWKTHYRETQPAGHLHAPTARLAAPAALVVIFFTEGNEANEATPMNYFSQEETERNRAVSVLGFNAKTAKS